MVDYSFNIVATFVHSSHNIDVGFVTFELAQQKIHAEAIAMPESNYSTFQRIIVKLTMNCHLSCSGNKLNVADIQPIN